MHFAKEDTHATNHTSSPSFPPYLDLPWFHPLAELAEGSVCFVHVVEHHKSLPGDVLTLQGLVYLLAQGRRIRHILVVLGDLPTQDHVAAVVQLGQWEWDVKTEKNSQSRVTTCDAGSAITERKANNNTSGFTQSAALERYLCDYGIADGTSDVVKVNIYPVGAALFEPRRNVLLAVVDGCSEAEVFHQSSALLISTADPDHSHTTIEPANLDTWKHDVLSLLCLYRWLDCIWYQL